MRVLPLLILLLMTAFAALSQDGSSNSGLCRLSGKVVDSVSAQPIEYATITLFRQSSSRPLAGTSTDNKGEFTIDSLQPTSYRLVIEFIGYRPKIRIIQLTLTKSNLSLGNIPLAGQAQTLTGVTVTGQKKVIENTIDKMVFNAERDITAQTGTASDLLQKVPQVSVDVDGNVELAGSGNVLFLINGKPSTIFGSNIADVLQSIPASQIKSIEVITNPGAKYDAQGTGGIINIVLKRSTLQGINGSISLTGGTISQFGSMNINARKGKFGLNAFLNGNGRLTTTTPTSFQRTSTDTTTKTTDILQQNGNPDFSRHGIQSGIGFDWTASERDNVSGALNYSEFGNHRRGDIYQSEQLQNIPGAPYSDTNSVNSTSSAFRQYSLDPNLDFKHTFSNSEQQLEIVADGSFSHNLVTTGNDQYLLPQDSLIYSTRNNNPAAESEYEAKMDYVQPLQKELKLGLGAKFSADDIASTGNALVWQPYSNSYIYSPALSNNLNYHQKVYAGYAEVTFPISKSIEGRLGGRYERTQVSAFYANAHQTVNNGYNTYIPSLFLMKKFGESQSLKLNFTIRINRPEYSDLNPFINTSDPKNITTGNPKLNPEIWDRLEASYNKDLGRTGSFMLTLYYRQSNGDIQPFINYYPTIQVGDTTYTNVAVTTQKNIGIEENAGTNIFFDLHVNDKFSIRSNTIVFYRHTINHVDPGYNSSTVIYRPNLNASYQVSSNFAAELFGIFNSHHHEAQGFYPAVVWYSLAFRKLFWDKKGSLALTVNNIFSKYVDQRTDLYGPGFVSSNLRRVPYRYVALNFTWKFGKLVLKPEKPEEVDTNLNTPQP